MLKPKAKKKKRVYVPVLSPYLEVDMDARTLTRPLRAVEHRVNLPTTLEIRPANKRPGARKFDPFR